nr:hypothetical protein [Micromonospora sp. DSM 115978]
VEVDTYAPTSRVGLWHSSARLEPGPHVAVVTNVARRNPASDAYVVAFDRAQVVTESNARIRQPWPDGLATAPPVAPTPLPPGPESNPSGMGWESGVTPSVRFAAAAAALSIQAEGAEAVAGRDRIERFVAEHAVASR